MLENFQQQNFASCHRTQQLGFQDEFAFFVLLAGLICFVVLPADRFVALLALDVPHNVPARGHISLHRFCLFDVDDG